jgi:nucleotide-binding universal stress UspA family protein
MSFKTILLHLNDEPRLVELVEAASFLARPVNAHVIGLYVVPPLPVPGEVIVGATEILEEQLKEFHAEAERIRNRFAELTKPEPYTTEWRFAAGPNLTIADAVVAESLTADLVIASQTNGSRRHPMLAQVPERVALESGRPVLVIPAEGRFASFGSQVTVAWDGRREAARAIFDSLPLLLRSAQNVRVLTVSNAKAATRANDVPGAEIATTLARHGLNVEATVTADLGEGVGKTLLLRSTNNGGDLLVMGAYGHSRTREFILGGATRDVLRHMTVPVLMAH